jgi:peptide/nickel transport system substrate-binding protein
LVRATAIGCALTIGLGACAAHHSGATRPVAAGAIVAGGGITVASEHELTSFNTNTSADDSPWATMITRLIWPQFAYQAPDGSVQPSFIAAGPAVVVSRNPFTVEWKIAPNAVWSDGVPVTSDDLAYYYESCNGRRDHGEAAVVDCVSTDGYDRITKFTEVDAKTAEATFASPIAEYASLFTSPMPPAHIARAYGAGAWTKAFVDSPVVSAGPYRLERWDHGTQLTLARNPKFWGPKAHLDTITFRFFSDPTQEPTALANGEVDVVDPGLAAGLGGAYAKLAGVTTSAGVGPEAEHLTFNLRNPILADPAVRRAIALAVDRGAIASTVGAMVGVRVQPLDNHVFFNAQTDYADNAGDLAAPNVSAAMQALDADGWVADAGGVRTKNGRRLTLRIVTTGGDHIREKTEEMLRTQLRAVGIDLETNNRPGASALDVVFGGAHTSRDWDIALFAWVHTAAPALDTAPVYRDGADSNPGAYSNPQIDQMFEQAIAELDAGKRRTLLDQIDRILWTDLPDLPLYQRPTFVASSVRYANVLANPTSEGLTWNAEQWGLRK